MSLLANSNAIESGGYNIDRSLRFRSSASAYLSRTPASAGNRRTFTWSGWVKRGTIGSSSYQYYFSASGELIWGFEGDAFRIQQMDGTGNNIWYIQTSQVFRDVSSWYHIVIAFDTTQATAANRVRMYVNGVEVTTFSSANYPTQNYDTSVNTAAAHNIGRSVRTSAYYFDGYLAEVNFIDGQALTPSSFGQTDPVTGVWTPKKYTGTYGTNGFYLPFTDNTSATTLAYDKSGNGNNWTPNNISTTAGATYDSMTDVPTLTSATAANYCVLNPLDPNISGLSVTLSNGNLTASGTTYGVAIYTCSMQIPQSAKWYYEMYYSTMSNNVIVGIRSYTTGSTDVQYRSDGQKGVGGTFSAYGSSWTTGDIIGIAVDRDGGTVTFYKNNVSQGAISIPTNAAVFDIACNTVSPFGSTVMNANFGQRPFSYTPPTGFKALNTFNLPDPTIKKPNQYMDVKVRTGAGAASSVTGIGFQPDFVWVKDRTAAQTHGLFDSVRGVQNLLQSNATAAELTSSGYLTAFNSDGYSFGSGTQFLNANTDNYVDWLWKKGATPGFDIVTYTGTGSNTTVAHSLGVAPKMMFIKNRASATNWIVYSDVIGAGNILQLNTTVASTAASTAFNSTAPTSSVFSVGTSTGTNQNGVSHVAYLFAEIAGFSKFGSYTGNGSATSGSFVYTGFRPKYVMIKRTDTTGEWNILDSSRNTYNVMGQLLWSDSSAAEATYNTCDFLSNGFKLYSTASDTNANGGTYIYMCFAENPFKYSLAR